MMENRLSLAKELMRENGVLFINIGDEEFANLIKLSEIVFGKANIITSFIRRKRAGGGNDSKYIAVEHDYVPVISKNIEKLKLNTLYRDLTKYKSDEYGLYLIKPLHEPTLQDSPGLHYDIECPDGTILSGKDHQWKISKEKFKELKEQNAIIFEKDKNGWVIKYKHYIDSEKGVLPSSILYNKVMNSNATSEMQALGFSFDVIKRIRPKPSSLVTHLLTIGSSKLDLIIDFFAGSGTTAHAVMKLNKEDGGRRKFILVEMADYFNTIIIPRIEKLSYSLNWKDGKPQDNDGISTFIKYYDLEQYEQTLRKCKYIKSEPFFDLDDKSIYEQYVFLKDPKLLDAMDLDYKNNKIRIRFDDIYPNIDIAETLSNLKGKWIKKITKNSVILRDDSNNEEEIRFDEIDFKTIKPLIWW